VRNIYETIPKMNWKTYYLNKKAGKISTKEDSKDLYLVKNFGKIVEIILRELYQDGLLLGTLLYCKMICFLSHNESK